MTESTSKSNVSDSENLSDQKSRRTMLDRIFHPTPRAKEDASVVAAVALLIILLVYGVYLVQNAKGETVLALSLIFGAIGGISHDIVASGGRITFVRRQRGGLELGTFSGAVLGLVSGFFIVGAAKVSAIPLPSEMANIASEAFLAGLALKGVGQAAVLAHWSGSAQTPNDTQKLPADRQKGG